MALLDLSRSPHGGRHRLLPENTTQVPITPRVLIYHSIVGSAQGAYEYFRTKSNLESTFIVRGSGKIWQLIDTERRADANYKANAFAISVETEDGGDPDTQPWTPAQLDALAWIAWEVHRLHGIPLVKAPRWDGSGIGYHSQFRGWSPVVKTCPGRVRIRQFHDVLLPRIARGPEVTDDMTPEQFDARFDDRMRKWAYRTLLYQKTGRANNYVNATTMPDLFADERPEPVWAMPDGAATAQIDEVLAEHGRMLQRHGGVLDQLLTAVAGAGPDAPTTVMDAVEPERRQ